MIQALAMVAISAGLLFFAAGTLGLLRLPDTHTRLHAITKADNVGLGLLVLGLCLVAPTAWDAALYLLAWLAVLVASATASHLVARFALRDRR